MKILEKAARVAGGGLGKSCRFKDTYPAGGGGGCGGATMWSLPAGLKGIKEEKRKRRK